MDDFPRRPAPLANALYDALADLVGKPVLATFDTGSSGGLTCVIRSTLHRVKTFDQHAHLLFGPHDQGTRVVLHTALLTDVSRSPHDDQALVVCAAGGDLAVKDLSPLARVVSWQRRIRETAGIPSASARVAHLRLIAGMIAAEIDQSTDSELTRALRAVLAAVGMLDDLQPNAAPEPPPWPPMPEASRPEADHDDWSDDDLDDDGDDRPWRSWPPE